MVKTQEMSVRITLLLQVRSVSVRITTWTLDGPSPPLTPMQRSARVLIQAIFYLFYATSEGHIPLATTASHKLATCYLPCFTVFLKGLRSHSRLVYWRWLTRCFGSGNANVLSSSFPFPEQ